MSDEAAKKIEEPVASLDETHVLFFAANKKKITPVINYLHRRGVKTGIVSSVKEALSYMVTKKPQFVFLSWDVQGAHMVKTEKVLTSTFKVNCISYSEKGETKTLMQISNSGVKYSLLGGVSGPSAYSKIKQIERDKKREEEASRQDEQLGRIGAEEQVTDSEKGNNLLTFKSEQKNKGRGTFVAKGVGRAAKGAASINKEQIELDEVPGEGKWVPIENQKTGADREWRFVPPDSQTAFTGSYIFQGEKPPTQNTDGEWQGAEGKVSFIEAPEGMELVAPEALPEEGNWESLGPKPGEGVPTHILMTDGKATHNGNRGMFYFEGETPPVAKEEGGWDFSKAVGNIFYFAKGDQAKEKKAKQEGQGYDGFGDYTDKKPQGKEFEIDMSKPKARGEGFVNSNNQQTENENPWKEASAEKKQENPESLKGVKLAFVRNENMRESILVKGVSEAIETVAIPSGVEKNAVEGTQHLGVIMVESPRFSGYLLFAVGKNKKVDAAFLETLKQTVYGVLKKHGEEATDHGKVVLTVQELDVKRWSQLYSEFTVLAQHEENEIALAFLASNKLVPELMQSADETMVGVKIDDISPNVKIDFDIRIHMPKNNKYFKYINPGSSLSEDQKRRMQEQKVTHFYISPDDKERLVAHYVLQNIQSEFKKNVA